VWKLLIDKIRFDLIFFCVAAAAAASRFDLIFLLAAADLIFFCWQQQKADLT